MQARRAKASGFRCCGDIHRNARCRIASGGGGGGGGSGSALLVASVALQPPQRVVEQDGTAEARFRIVDLPQFGQ